MNASPKSSPSAAIRQRLDHPVVDTDGHCIEYMPALQEVLAEVGGPELAKRYASRQINWHRYSREERYDKRTIRPPWWGIPARNTLDRATAMLPALLRERLDEFGIDFCIVYPTNGLFFIGEQDEEMRKATCRALNIYNARIFGPHADRLTPVATIPLNTPQEGIEELDYAVGELGLKSIIIPGHIRRPVPEVERTAPQAKRYSYWLDHLALGSPHDYDPFWARCMELKVAVTEHSGGMGWGSRTTIDNYMYNHIGHFAAAGEAFCKAVIMGGVRRRFPDLNFAFLEGGVAWATVLLADLRSHWEKRNKDAVMNYDPDSMDLEQMADLFDRYGKEVLAGGVDRNGFKDDFLTRYAEDPQLLDEFAACGFSRTEDIDNQFTPRFFFGCEADDPANAMAFSAQNPCGTPLNAIFASDIGHWDVPDMREVLEEAYELVERKMLSEEDFKQFVFTNPVSLHGGMNPDFFKGTPVEDAAAKVLAGNVVPGNA